MLHDPLDFENPAEPDAKNIAVAVGSRPVTLLEGVCPTAAVAAGPEAELQRLADLPDLIHSDLHFAGF